MGCTKLISFLVLGLGCMALGAYQAESPTIYLIGDSTCADKSVDSYPETGWGTPFKYFFDGVPVENHAKNGRSTKSFLEEGLWEKVKERLKPNDYVFIQFGHNDEVPTKVGRYTTPEEYRINLSRYIQETRGHGSFPVLLTPVTRRSFEEGKLKNTHEQYAQLVLDVANELNVPLIDMTKKSMDLVESWGEEKSELLYLHLVQGEHPNYPNGSEDNTHFNELGARKMAQLVLEGIRSSDMELKSFIVNQSK